MSMKRKTRATFALAGAAAAAALSLAGGANANITYAVNQVDGSGGVIGDIVTNGATGVLTGGDILSWNLTLNGVGASFNLNNGNSGVFIGGADTTATPTHIYYN